MSSDDTHTITEEQARAMMAVLGRAEGEFVVSLTAPIYWITRDEDGRRRVRNGSVFFLDAGKGPFAVTANHVIKRWKEDSKAGIATDLQIGREFCPDFDGENAIVSSHDEIDLLTFQISKKAIDSIGKTVLTGYQENWPPTPPTQGKGIYYAGYPSFETILMTENEISFGAASGGGVASSVSESDVSSLIERKYLIPTLGGEVPGESYDFGGMSGGPMLSVIEHKGIRTWALAGVIYEGPNPSSNNEEAIAGLQIMKARRGHFIRPDGTLDVQLWNSL